jgi:hypothetical protein
VPVCDKTWDNRTVGLLMCSPEASPGYTLFAPIQFTETYLVDIDGKMVHSWSSDYQPGESVYLEDNGHLLRTAKDTIGTPFNAGGAGGRVEEFDWDGTLVWSFGYKSETHLQHHDIERLPSGNVLMIAWELKTQAEALAAGRDPTKLADAGVWVDHLIEVDPTTDAIVWEWHIWDHLVQQYDETQGNYGIVADQPGRIDFNRTLDDGVDWNHVNGLDYNAELDQIVVSSHHQDELWIIDHNTTTAEAAGPAGDLLYRWGNPQMYDAGAPADTLLSGQHDPEWIAEGLPGAGNIILFNNGVDWGYSQAYEITPAVEADGSYPRTAGEAWGPVGPTWTYEDPDGFFSSFISGVQRLPNGNTLICEGALGRFFEVTVDGEIVWEFVNPVDSGGPVAQGTSPGGFGFLVFRADRYAPDYMAFEGKDLSSQGSIQL